MFPAALRLSGPAGAGNAPPPPATQLVPLVFVSVTRASSTGLIYVKIVNRAETPQAVHVSITGVSTIEAKGQSVAMSAANPADTNSITAPTKIVPVSTNIDGLGTGFTKTLPPYSITILQMRGQ